MHTTLSLLLFAVLPSLRERASLQLELIALRHRLLVREWQPDPKSCEVEADQAADGG